LRFEWEAPVSPPQAAQNAAAPNAAAPNAAAPNTATPNAATPNAATPNAAAPNTATPNTAAPTAAAAKGYEVRQLDSDEIAALLKRGDQLIASGDLAAARLVLQRAAEAEDARAALALAGTYDPIVLERRALHGFTPNIALARIWYERAEQFGSTDAPRRLEMLASRRD
jgi:hypothetical protein